MRDRDDLVFEARQEQEIFLQIVQTGWGRTKPPTQWVTVFGGAAGDKSAGAWSSPRTSSVEIKNEWSCTATLLISLRGRDRDLSYK